MPYLPLLLPSLQTVRVVGVAANEYHSLALSETGRVYSWGGDNCGQLGHGDFEYEHTPKLIEALQGVGVSSVAALYGCSLAVSKLGAVYSWGQGQHGRLGHGDKQSRHSPELVEGVRALKA